MNIIGIAIGVAAQGGGAGPTLPTLSGITFGLSGGNYGINYTFSTPADEQNQAPRVKDIQITGTLGVGEDLTITSTILNNTPYALKDVECKVYRASSLQGVSDTLVTTITNDTGIFTYTQVTADEGKYIRAVVTPKIDNGNNKVGEVYSSQYTDQVPIPSSIYDVFDIFNFQAWELADGTFTSWENKANLAAPAIAGANPPTVTKGAVVFTAASSHTIDVPNPAIAQTWVHYKLIRPLALGVTQVPDTITNNSQFRLQSNRHMYVNNTDTTVLYPNDSTKPYLLKVVHAGASSSINIATYSEPGGVPTFTWGTPTTFNNNSPAIGAGTGKLGSAGTSFYWSGAYHAYLASSNLLTTGEENDITADLAQQVYNWLH